jgi:hypothetical protein
MKPAMTAVSLKAQIETALRLEDEFDFQAEALRLRRLEREQLYPVFDELLREATEEASAERLCSALVRMGGAAALSIFVGYVQDGGLFAPVAVGAIGRLRLNESLDTILLFLDMGSLRVRAAAMETLVRMHSPAAIAPLYRISADPNDRLQEEAAKALASLIGAKLTAESARYLVDQLIETDAMPRAAIVEGLQAVDEIFPNTPSIERLNASTKAGGWRAVGCIEGARAVAATDDDGSCRVAEACACGKCGEPIAPDRDRRSVRDRRSGGVSQAYSIETYQDPIHLARMARLLEQLSERISKDRMGLGIDPESVKDASEACKLGSIYIDAKRATLILERISRQDYTTLRKKTARIFTVDSLLVALTLTVDAKTFRRIVTLLADQGTDEAIAGIERAARTHPQYQATAQMVLRNTAANPESIEALARIAITGSHEQRLTAIRNLGNCARGTIVAPLCRIMLADPQYGAHASNALTHIGNTAIVGRKVLAEGALDIPSKVDALALLAQTHKFDAVSFVASQMRHARGAELAIYTEIQEKVRQRATLLRPSQQEVRDQLLRPAGMSETPDMSSLLRAYTDDPAAESTPEKQGLIGWLKSLVG